MRTIILCADDYGQNAAISQGILELVAQRRLSAVSCLVNYADWPTYAAWLKPYINKIDIGLHFDLTNSYADLLKLITTSNLRLLNRKKITAAINQQLNTFISSFGKYPDFIDGHQHIHQLPIISDAILAVYNERLTTPQPYIRWVPEHTEMQSLKSLAIALASDCGFKHKLSRAQIPFNPSFGGIYNFKHSSNYSQIFPHFLAKITDRGIIMCHPGQSSTDQNDPLATSRHHELQYFLSDQFVADCRQQQIIVGAGFPHPGSPGEQQCAG